MTLEQYVTNNLVDVKQYNKDLYYNSTHFDDQKQFPLRFFDVYTDEHDTRMPVKLDRPKISKHLGEIIYDITTGKIELEDYEIDRTKPIDDVYFDVFNKVYDTFIRLYDLQTPEDVDAYNNEDYNTFFFNKEGVFELTDVEREAKALFRKTSVARFNSNPELGFQAMTNIFGQARPSEFTTEERYADRFGVNEVSPKVALTYQTKLFGFNLSKDSLSEALEYYKAVKNDYDEKSRNSLWFRIKSHLWGKTASFKHELNHMEEYMLSRGITRDEINSYISGTKTTNDIIAERELQGQKLETRAEQKNKLNDRLKAIENAAINKDKVDAQAAFAKKEEDRKRSILMKPENKTLREALHKELIAKMKEDLKPLTDNNPEFAANVNKSTSLTQLRDMAKAVDEVFANNLYRNIRTEENNLDNKLLMLDSISNKTATLTKEELAKFNSDFDKEYTKRMDIVTNGKEDIINSLAEEESITPADAKAKYGTYSKDGLLEQLGLTNSKESDRLNKVINDKLADFDKALLAKVDTILKNIGVDLNDANRQKIEIIDDEELEDNLNINEIVNNQEVKDLSK